MVFLGWNGFFGMEWFFLDELDGMGGLIMTPEQFDIFLDESLKKIKNTLGNKSKEYAFNNDRLFNFKQAAKINDCSVEKAVWGMATKHLVSVIDLVENRLLPDHNVIDEKIFDLINYLLLLRAVYDERDK